MTVVDDDSAVSTSTQFITVPFRPLLTGLISNLDITGKLFSADVLERLNTVELTTNCDIASLAEPVGMIVRVNSVLTVSFPHITLNLHLRNCPVVVHIKSN